MTQVPIRLHEHKIEHFCQRHHIVYLALFGSVLTSRFTEEIIGEAAKRLPDNVGRQMPEIDWEKVRGFRDIIAHEYFGIDAEIIWNVIHNKIPELLKVISTLYIFLPDFHNLLTHNQL